MSKVFYGCRHPEHDWFYRDEVQSWQQAGIAEVHLAFSTVPAHPYRFVQDAITADGWMVYPATHMCARPRRGRASCPPREAIC
ncbi:hypothetical protein [Catellatospora sp. NPDC049133]|uniref:hypothetical protein n=1 Tax=Catellatospora sp. NPDC049133 TaxID=3155499 RepID=UPI0034082B66